MNDTPEKVSRMYDAMFTKLTHEERARMGCSMHDTSKEIVLSQIGIEGRPRSEVMGDLFLRFYGGDFHGPQLESVLNAVRQYHAGV